MEHNQREWFPESVIYLATRERMSLLFLRIAMFFFLFNRHIRGLVFCLMLVFVAGSNVSCFVDGDETDDSSSVTTAQTAALTSRRTGQLPKFQSSGWIKTNPIEAHAACPRPARDAGVHETSSLPLIVPLRT